MGNTGFFVKSHDGQRGNLLVDPDKAEVLKVEFRRRIFLKLIVIVLLCAMTLGFFSTYERYEFSGEDILDSSGFRQGLKNWDKKYPGGGVTANDQGVLQMHSRDGQEIMYVRQYIKNIQGYRLLQFTGKMRTEEVEQGKKPWQVAHLLVIGIDAVGKKLWRAPYLLAKQHGTNDWKRYEQVFKLDEDVEEFLVSIQLPMVKGTVWAKELSLRPVSEKPAYKVFWIIAIALWIIVISWVLTDYFRSNGFSLKQAPTAFLLGGVVVGILMPHHIIMRISDFLLSLSPLASDAVILADRAGFTDMYPIWHFLAFASLALVVYWRVTSLRRLAQNFGLLVLFASVTEVLQLLVDSRKSELMDFAVDVAGIVAALVVWSAWRAIKGALGRKMVKSC